MNIYDIDGIISEALRSHIDISPADREEWKMFCCALKVLEYDENTFVALSSGAERDSRQAWRDEKKPGKYKSVESAKGMIVKLAKDAGMNVKRFLLSHSDNSPRASAPVPRTTPPPTATPEPPKQPPYFVGLDEVRKAAAEVYRTNLFNFLCRLFPSDDVTRVMGLYLVGATNQFKTSTAPASTFPYINISGQCVDVHLQPYDVNGHRWKKEQHKYCQDWQVRVDGQSERRAPWCLFGEHLLKSRPAAPVGLVESEKTALICALAAPGYVWVACQGLSNFNAERCDKIRNRAVYVFPDVDGVEAWKAKAADLCKAGFKLYFCGDFIRENATSPKDDIGDIIINTLKN